MMLFRDLFVKMSKKRGEDEPWLAYYSKEERKIKFTDKTIYDYLIDSVGEDKDFVALNYFGNKISYNLLFDKVDQASRALRSLGVKQGDIVTICMPNTPEAVIVFYACNKIGAIADMIHPLSSAAQVKHYLQESKSRILFLIDISYERVKDILPETLVYKTIITSPKDSMPALLNVGYRVTRDFKVKKPRFDKDFISWSDFMLSSFTYNKPCVNTMKSNDIAVILHSGGTTGSPKGIMLSNFNFNAEAQQDGVVVYEVRPQDKILTILPIFHGFGLCVCIHAPLCLKLETILMPEFDKDRFYKIMKNDKPNVLAGVPTLWEAMLDNDKFEDVDLSQLKYLISGGDYLTIPMEKRINNFLHSHNARISVSKGYGMTESVAATAFTFEGTNEPGSIGIPIVGNDFCICDPETEEILPFGHEGEICVNGPTVMVGYLNNEEETKKVLRKHKDGKIWLHTGDIGYITPDGIIYFTQRLKRMIISSGFNVYPNMIEETIEKHPGVKKCCVIGVPHPYKMEVPKAFIVINDGYKINGKLKKELKELCKQELAAYSIPKDFEFRDELPKTLVGKVDFKRLEREEIVKNNETKS